MKTEKAERMKWQFFSPPEFTDAMRNKFLPLFNDELLKLIPEWKFIQDRDDNSVEWHTYVVSHLISKEPLFLQMNHND